MPTFHNPPTLAKPSGFSHGIVTQGGRTLYIAGQTAMDASGKIVASPPDMVGQFRQVLSNIKTVIDAAGGQMTDIVKMTIFVTDKAAYQLNLKEIGKIYQSYFGKHYPVMALIEIKSLWDEEAMIEIESVAVLGSSG
jgi:enamine deaminase RidA (YjgF/YER057c/UK114 family)